VRPSQSHVRSGKVRSGQDRPDQLGYVRLDHVKDKLTSGLVRPRQIRPSQIKTKLKLSQGRSRSGQDR